MQALTFNQVIQNFANFMDEVNHNHEPLVITHENHQSVVLMSLNDFNVWQETLYLTRSSANADDLRQAVQDIKAQRHLVKHALI